MYCKTCYYIVVSLAPIFVSDILMHNRLTVIVKCIKKMESNRLKYYGQGPAENFIQIRSYFVLLCQVYKSPYLKVRWVWEHSDMKTFVSILKISRRCWYNTEEYSEFENVSRTYTLQCKMNLDPAN